MALCVTLSVTSFPRAIQALFRDFFLLDDNDKHGMIGGAWGLCFIVVPESIFSVFYLPLLSLILLLPLFLLQHW